MATKDLSREPRDLGDSGNIWYYEETKGLEVHVQYPEVPDRCHESVIIPWGLVRAALKRKDK